MRTISRNSIMTLEAYAKARQKFRAEVMSHKKKRKISLGENVTLIFEDELTIRYQIQEMLRAEKIFEEKGILEEIETYKALIPDGKNWKATMMIEYPDPAVRAEKLSELVGIENKVWIKINNHSAVFAIADEDLDRSTNEKTSAVHFLRFELKQDMINSLHNNTTLSIGIKHPAYQVQVEQVDKLIINSLIDDLD